jgi:hypothetical protein
MARLAVTFPGSEIDCGVEELDRWRCALYEGVLGCRGQTLFAMVDAIAGARGRCGCPAHASLEGPVGHAAFYRALGEGLVDVEGAVGQACGVADRVGLPRVYAIDTTAWPRPYAPTSPDRQPQYTPGGPRGSALIRTGWRYQQVVRLTLTPDSWVLPVLLRRIASTDDLVAVTIAQIRQVCARDGASAQAPSLFLLDSGYPAARITYLLRENNVPAEVLVRLSTSQTMWTRPEVKAAHPLGGRPRRHGLRLPLRAPDLPADFGISAPVDIYGTVTVQAWHQVHPKINRSSRGFADHPDPPIVEGTVLLARVQHLRPSRRAGDLALWYSGTRTDLITLVMTYLARFDAEHYFRYLKTTARAGDFPPRRPRALTLWLRLHALAYLQLFLARPHVTDALLPWETRHHHTLTPGQVRRRVSPALANAWHPPDRPKPTHPGPGRPAGRRRVRRQRHPVIRKNAIHKGK